MPQAPRPYPGKEKIPRPPPPPPPPPPRKESKTYIVVIEKNI